MNPRRAAATAAILVVPSIVVAVVVATRRSAPPDAGRPAAPAPVSAPAAEAVEVTGRLEPYQSVVFTSPLDPSAAPAAASCRAAMSAMQKLGAAPAHIGRLTIGFRATRTVQLRVTKVTVRTVRREDARLTAVASCAAEPVPTPLPGDPVFNESFKFGSDGYSFEVPVLRLADQQAETVPPMEVAVSEPVEIGETTVAFRIGDTTAIPVYLLTSGGPTFRTGIEIDVDLTVNGVAHRRTVTDGGAPFWMYEANFRVGDGPIRQWLPANRTWRSF